MIVNQSSSTSTLVPPYSNTDNQPPSKKRKANDGTATGMRAPQIDVASSLPSVNNPFGNGPRANSSRSYSSQYSSSVATPKADLTTATKNSTSLNKAVVENDRKRSRDEMIKDFSQVSLAPSTSNNLDDAIIQELGAIKVSVDILPVL